MVSAIRAICYFFLTVGFLKSQILPPGTTLNARLTGVTGSRVSRPGNPVEAVIISPVTLRGNVVIPQGAIVRGDIRQAVPIGLGIRHQTATLHYRFLTLQSQNGPILPIDAELLTVETAKERVDSEGVVLGVHPGANLSSASGFYTLPLVFLNPVFGIPLWGIKALIAPSTSPEIYFPSGTECTLVLKSPLDISALPFATQPVGAFSESEITHFGKHLEKSHIQALAGKRPSDLVNLLFVGTRPQIEAAFQAAGWVTAERGSPLALYRMYNALTKRVGYRTAPMNPLRLNGNRSDFVYQKSLNDIAARHHARFFRQSDSSDIWFGTATEDVALCFRRMHWTHRIDPEIDRERAKIVNDLAFTGCVDSAGLLSRSQRSGLPGATDGEVALVRFNSCERPKVMPGVDEQNASRPERWLPRVALSFRDDVIKNNPAFTAYNTFRSLAAKQRTKEPSLKFDARKGTPLLDWVKAAQRLEVSTNE